MARRFNRLRTRGGWGNCPCEGKFRPRARAGPGREAPARAAGAAAEAALACTSAARLLSLRPRPGALLPSAAPARARATRDDPTPPPPPPPPMIPPQPASEEEEGGTTGGRAAVAAQARGPPGPTQDPAPRPRPYLSRAVPAPELGAGDLMSRGGGVLVLYRPTPRVSSAPLGVSRRG